MKKLIYFILILALLLPVGAVFAKEPVTFEIEFRNRTGGVVSLSMEDANGNKTFSDVPEGVSTLDVPEGVYQYYASTLCGVEVGTWNMNVKKVAIFKCEADGELFVDLDRMCYFPGWTIEQFIFAKVNGFLIWVPKPYPGNFSHSTGCWDIIIF